MFFHCMWLDEHMCRNGGESRKKESCKSRIFIIKIILQYIFLFSDNLYVLQSHAGITGYGGVIPQYEILQFVVSVCVGGASVTLKTEGGSDAGYTINIGVSTPDHITITSSQQTDPLAEVFFPDILTCGKNHPFWLTWDNGVIRMGIGFFTDIGAIISWTDNNLGVVTDVYYRVNGHQDDPLSVGRWEFFPSESKSELRDIPQNGL